MEPELRFKGLPRHDKAGVSRVHEHLEVNHLQQRSRSYCENGQLGEDMHLFKGSLGEKLPSYEVLKMQ